MMRSLCELPRAYMTGRAEYFTEENRAMRPEEVISRSDEDMSRFRKPLDSSRITYSSADISAVKESGIMLSDGVFIDFSECAENRRLQYPDSVSVAGRDIAADPPYYDFYTSFMITRIVFDKTGFSADKHNAQDINDLYGKIIKAGYNIYDLS